MRNVFVGIKPFIATGDYTISNATSEQASYPAANTQQIIWPFRPWKSADTALQDMVLRMPSTTALKGLFVNNVNYPAIQLLSSPDGSSVTMCTPNLLLWNEKPRRTVGVGVPEAPWSTSGTVTVDPAGPVSALPSKTSQEIILNSGAYLLQDVNILNALNGKTFTVSVWLRTKGGTGTIWTRISDAGANVNDKQHSITDRWGRYHHTYTFVAGSVTTVRLALLRSGAGDLGNVLFGGMQATLGTATPLLTNYETQASGLIVGKDSRHGRRKTYLDMNGFNAQYLHYRIPASQTTDDSQSAYSTGEVVPFDNLAPLFGGHQYPIDLEIVSPALRTEFESGGTEYLQLGYPHVRITLPGTQVARYLETTYLNLAKQTPGSPVLFFENVHDPEGPDDWPDPTHAYICRVDPGGKFQYSIPELFDNEITYEEII